MSARSLFHSPKKKFSVAEDKLYSRESLIYNATEDLLVQMEKRNVTKSELARSLSKSLSFVSQILSGKRNMTLRTLSDVCFELKCKPRIVLEDLEEECAAPSSNYLTMRGLPSGAVVDDPSDAQIAFGNPECSQ